MSFTNRRKPSDDIPFAGHYGSFASFSKACDSDVVSDVVDPVHSVVQTPQDIIRYRNDYQNAMSSLRGALVEGVELECLLNKIIAQLQPKYFAWTQSLWRGPLTMVSEYKQHVTSFNWPFDLDAAELEKLLVELNFNSTYFKNTINTRNELRDELIKASRFMSSVYSFTAENCQQLSRFKSVAWYQQLAKDLDLYLAKLTIERPSRFLDDHGRKIRIWPFELDEEQLTDFIRRMGEFTLFLSRNGYLIEPMLLADYQQFFAVDRQVIVADLTIYKRQLAGFFSVVNRQADEKKSDKKDIRRDAHAESKHSTGRFFKEIDNSNALVRLETPSHVADKAIVL